MADLPSFADLAAVPDPPLDALALALAAEFREVDAAAAFARLDALGERLSERLEATPPVPAEEARVTAAVLGGEEAFVGDDEDYDHPDNSMLDLVLERRRGLPILLSVVYVEVARRAGIALAGVGLPGHYVVGHFGEVPPLLLDPFDGGARLNPSTALDLRAWGPHETALRMLNNLVGSYRRRADLARAIRAAELRLELPLDDSATAAYGAELRSLQASLN